jgi:hypothetical protein
MDISPASPDGHQPLSDNRFAELCATLHELEQTHARPDHPGITHLKWLIATHLAEVDGARSFARSPRPGLRRSDR